MTPHLKYLRYVLVHKWFVLLAGLRIGPPAGLPVLRHLRWWLQLAVHDWSKFLPSEWGPYVRKFYTHVQVGERVDGSADNAPFDGVVLATRPTKGVTRPMVDCYIDDGRKPWWAWGWEVERRREVDAAFDGAWLRHQNRQPHHWQYWLLVMDCPRTGKAAPYDHRADPQVQRLPIPERYLREMVADWAGAGRAITGAWEVADWYTKNQGNIKLHGDTRHAVERLLEQFPSPKSAGETSRFIQDTAREIGDDLEASAAMSRR